MAATHFLSVDEYLSTQPESSRAALALVRGALLKALPHAEETISYNIPAYKLHGAVVIYFAGWKKHYSLYPATAGVRLKFRDELAGYEVNDKGTIRFSLAENVPLGLIGRIAKMRAKETAESARAKKSNSRSG